MVNNSKLQHQIRISKELKNYLDKNKLIKRETYDDVIKRLIKNATDKHYTTKA